MAEWKAGRPITKNQLAGLLAKYGIRPRATRLPDGRRLKGYARELFEDAWARYLPPDSPLPPESNRDTLTNRMNTGENGDFRFVTPDSCHPSENAVSANKNEPCHGVTVQKRGDGHKTVERDQPEARNLSAEDAEQKPVSVPDIEGEI